MKNLRTIGTIGAALALLGSFLPWEEEGDFIPHWTYGIRLFPQPSDDGGLLIVLLTISIIILAFRPPRIVKSTERWILVLASLLMTASIIFVLRWLVHRVASAGIIGAASLEIGLIAVAVGSSLLFLSSIINYRQARSAG
jgi:hypothetical protein